MTDSERREAARQFYQKWVNRGKEDEDDRSYWIDFLQDVMGVDRVTDRIEFQKKVVGPDGNTKRIDAYIPETRVLIEQKSLGIDLSKPQAAHNGMTPYEQAKMYDNSLPVSEKARWIILSNFREIWVYDMDVRVPEPQIFELSEIPAKYSLFEFLVNKKETKISHEMEVSVKAGEFVGLIYDALLKQYINPESEESLKSLNMLCVRLVFCLYAEDAHIFGSNGHMFHDYLAQFETKDLRKALIEIFKILDTPENQRDPYDTSDLSKFPYVNGGLFAEEQIEIPHFTDEIRDILLTKASAGFDWSMISPTIFGAVFESTLNPETRRSGGMHYTSVENIHKVIDPLFLDDLKEEFGEIDAIQVEKTKKPKLEAFQNKLAVLKWLDPACGSGNFLTETYISIRRLENQVIRGILDCDRKQVDGQIVFGTQTENPIKVEISQFYGIEINDFAVTVAKTALWIAESQMMKETEDIIHMSLDFLPLTTNANIVEGNALRLDWREVISSSELNYIMGNPPFVGMKEMSADQKSDLKSVVNIKNLKQMDYVAGWYYKAATYINATGIECAFVSSNSICQGEQALTIWAPLFERGIEIEFARQTFIWDSEASIKAHVHCVIVGFSCRKKRQKTIYIDDHIIRCENINQYLANGESIFIQKMGKPLCAVPEMTKGAQLIDDGNFMVGTESEYNKVVLEEPDIKPYIRKYMNGRSLLSGDPPQYVLYLEDCPPDVINSSNYLKNKVKAVYEFRANNTSPSTNVLKDIPAHYFQAQVPNGKCIVFSAISSGNRRYIPMAFLDERMVLPNTIFFIDGAELFHFGILMSNVHMAWARTLCGRLKSDYRYSNTMVYNTFPWPETTDEQRMLIEKTAQGILNARALYPNSSLSDLYDPLTMPLELQKAHTANDRAVMQAYGFSVKDITEADCVAELMKMYQELTNNK